MTDGDITKGKMESLYEDPKRLLEPIHWKQNQYATHRFSTRSQVEAIEGKELLSVAGEYWIKRYSFSLFYRNTAIVRWDFSNHHPGISDGHKHYYPTEEKRGDNPRSVDDVTTTDVNQALLDFLDECNIDHGSAKIEKITGLSDYE